MLSGSMGATRPSLMVMVAASKPTAMITAANTVSPTSPPQDVDMYSPTCTNDQFVKLQNQICALSVNLHLRDEQTNGRTDKETHLCLSVCQSINQSIKTHSIAPYVASESEKCPFVRSFVRLSLNRRTTQETRQLRLATRISSPSASSAIWAAT